MTGALLLTRRNPFTAQPEYFRHRWAALAGMVFEVYGGAASDTAVWVVRPALGDVTPEAQRAWRHGPVHDAAVGITHGLDAAREWILRHVGTQEFVRARAEWAALPREPTAVRAQVRYWQPPAREAPGVDLGALPHATPLTAGGRYQAGWREPGWYERPDPATDTQQHMMVVSHRADVGRRVGAVVAAACDPVRTILAPGAPVDALNVGTPDRRCARPGCRALYGRALAEEAVVAAAEQDARAVVCAAPGCPAHRHLLDLRAGWFASSSPGGDPMHLCPDHSGAWADTGHLPVDNPGRGGCACGWRVPVGFVSRLAGDAAYRAHLGPHLVPAGAA